jgi:hypothetical protein
LLGSGLPGSAAPAAKPMLAAAHHDQKRKWRSISRSVLSVILPQVAR